MNQEKGVFHRVKPGESYNKQLDLNYFRPAQKRKSQGQTPEY